MQVRRKKQAKTKTRSKKLSKKQKIKCISCDKVIKPLSQAFPLADKFIHFNCLKSEIENNEYPIHDFSLSYTFYLEDRKRDREVYISGNKLYSNELAKNILNPNSKALISLLPGGMFGISKVLGLQILLPYSYVKEQYDKQSKNYLVYYVASRIKLLDINEMHCFYNDINVVAPALNSPTNSYPIMINFNQNPPEHVEKWLNGFCQRQNNIFFTNSGLMVRCLDVDRDIVVRCSNFIKSEDFIRDNVIKFLNGEAIETVQIKPKPDGGKIDRSDRPIDQQNRSSNPQQGRENNSGPRRDPNQRKDNERKTNRPGKETIQ